MQFRTVARSLDGDSRFSEIDAWLTAQRFTGPLLKLLKDELLHPITYAGLLRTQIQLCKYALANEIGKGSPDREIIVSSVEAARDKLTHELSLRGDLAEEVERITIGTLLNDAALRRYNEGGRQLTYSQLLQLDAGCLLECLVGAWRR